MAYMQAVHRFGHYNSRSFTNSCECLIWFQNHCINPKAWVVIESNDLIEGFKMFLYDSDKQDFVPFVNGTTASLV